jgi:ubiquinone biosynthesis monooxygenase Coq7
MPKPYFFNKNKKDQQIIMVNHAGEYGAQRIYQGQIDFTKSQKDKALLQHMLEQEQEHLDYFKNKIMEKKLRPTVLLPIWNIIGYGVGALSALSGAKASMLLTEGVEEVIIEHYQQQIDYLEQVDTKNTMLPYIKKFKEDEAEHQQIAIDNDSRHTLFYNILSRAVKTSCRAAIFLSKRI